MISHLQFKTARLSIQNWEVILGDPSKRTKLERELKNILTPKITHHLPLSMQLSADKASISQWVDDRAKEAQILCVHTRDTDELAGLIILFDNPEEGSNPTIHLGYLLGEPNWGKGYATEMIKALVTALRGGPRVRIAAGVDYDNIASVGVLEKSGFRKMPAQTAPGQHFFELFID